MKFYATCALLGSAQAGMFSWIPGMGSSTSTVPLTPEQKLENTKWWVDGMKGYYDGYYRNFYKTRESEDMANCLDMETTNNIVKWGNVVAHPMDIMSNVANLTEDFNLFAEGAEIMENVSKCHFEQSAFDLMHMCTQDPEACTMTKLMNNVTTGMFILMGKATSMAETLKDFPATDKRDYQEQMKELGGDAGTFFRVFFNF